MNGPAPRPDRDAVRFDLDFLDRGRELQRDPRRKAADDQVAVSAGRAQVDVCRGRVIGEVIGRGDAFQRRPADEAADRLEIGVPFAAFGKRVGGAVAGRRRVGQPLQPGGERRSGGFLFVRRKAEVSVLHAPLGRPPVDDEAGLLRDAPPGIAVARVQPAAAEVEPIPSNLDRPCPSAEAGARLQQNRRMSARGQRARSADSCRAAANDHNVKVCVHRASRLGSFHPPGMKRRQPASCSGPCLPGSMAPWQWRLAQSPT